MIHQFLQGADDDSMQNLSQISNSLRKLWALSISLPPYRLHFERCLSNTIAFFIGLCLNGDDQNTLHFHDDWQSDFISVTYGLVRIKQRSSKLMW